MILFLIYLLGILAVLYGAYLFYGSLTRDAGIQDRMNKIVLTNQAEKRIKDFVNQNGFSDKAKQIKNFIQGKE